MSEELKPCPFCGSEAEIIEKFMPPKMSGHREVISAEVMHFCPRVEGQPHGMSVKQIGRDRQSAIKAWNTRTDTHQDAEIKAARDAVEALKCLKTYRHFLPDENKNLFVKHVETAITALQPKAVDVEQLKRTAPSDPQAHDMYLCNGDNVYDIGWNTAIDHLNERGLIAGNQWQPIETALKDGTDIIMIWSPLYKEPQKAYADSWWTCGFSVENKPTHWLLIPKPPKGEE